jgi:hypothetical protein
MSIAFTASEASDWTSALADLATVAAILVGGWWTYTRFIKERGDAARAALTVTADDRSLGADILLRTVLHLENSGSVLLPVERVRCEIYQVTPPAESTLERLRGRELIDRDEQHAQLECIKGYVKEWSPGEVEVEPGESEEFTFEFVVPAEVLTISIYGQVPNTAKGGEIGWDAAAFYDLQAAQRGGDNERSREEIN